MIQAMVINRRELTNRTIEDDIMNRRKAVKLVIYSSNILTAPLFSASWVESDWGWHDKND